MYVGIVTLFLAVLVLLYPRLRRNHRFQHPWSWFLLAVCSLVFATGWPVVWFPWVPGLNFFRGPGRYSMIAALAISLLGGAGLDALLERTGFKLRGRFLLTSVVLLWSVVDLWSASRQYDFGIAPYVGRKVFYAVMVNHPPLQFRNESSLRHHFADTAATVRLYAPGANLPTLLGVSALPVYLGLGPEIYESEAMKVRFDTVDPAVIQEECDRLRKFGVTHLLLESPLPDAQKWPVIERGQWTDHLLQSALAKRTPFYLYEVQDSPGRISLMDSSTRKIIPQGIRHVTIEPQRVRVEVDCDRDCTLVLRDLDYPGWRLTDSGQTPFQIEGLFRGVRITPGLSKTTTQTVEWIYQPRSVFLGAFISAITLLGWTCCAINVPGRLSSLMFHKK